MARPIESFDQCLLSAALEISPEPSEMRSIHDLSGSAISAVRFDRRTERLDVIVRADLDHRPERCACAQDDDSALDAEGFAYDADDDRALAPFLERAPADPDGALEGWARRFLKPVGRTRLATLLSDMTHAIRSEFAYELRTAGKPQSAAETLERGRGSCRDFAVLMAASARRFGIATQFVSGYVYGPAGGAAPTGGGHTHAWVRAYLPEVGWCDFDPTNGGVGPRGLVRVAAVAQPRDAVPLHGTWSGFASDFIGLDVDVTIRAFEEGAAQPFEAEGIAHPRH